MAVRAGTSPATARNPRRRATLRDDQRRAIPRCGEERRTAGLRLAAELLPTLAPDERERALGRVVDSLREQVEPYAKLDEMLLFPEVGAPLGDPLVAASMNYDRLAIRHWIDLLRAADVTDTARLQRLLYGLDALISVHSWKENELFLASVDSLSGTES